MDERRRATGDAPSAGLVDGLRALVAVKMTPDARGGAAAIPASLPLPDKVSLFPGRRRAALIPCAAGALALLWLTFSLGARSLTLPDEGRYVGVAWEMLRSGNWLIPTENGLPFFHKPPLFYWLTAGSMSIFGTGAAAARLAPLLGACLSALGLYLVARRWAGERAARWTLLVLLTQPFFFGGAQFANLDMLVAACIALAILLAAHASLLIRNGLAHRTALLGAWAAAAFGVLAKGLIGVVLPGLVVVLWLALSGQGRTILRLCWPAGPALFVLIAAPWFIAVQARYPDFGHFFFVYQHFERFARGGFNNVQPWWFFAAVLPALTLPWSLWLLRSTFGARPGESAEATLWRRLMWVWLAAVLVFFSIPQSKPVGYAMPMLFPLAALCADALLGQTRAGPGGSPAHPAPGAGEHGAGGDDLRGDGDVLRARLAPQQHRAGPDAAAAARAGRAGGLRGGLLLRRAAACPAGRAGAGAERLARSGHRPARQLEARAGRGHSLRSAARRFSPPRREEGAGAALSRCAALGRHARRRARRDAGRRRRSVHRAVERSFSLAPDS